MKELLHFSEYKGIWRGLHFEVGDEGARCGALSFISSSSHF
jgi:hypothetical protein